MNKDQSTEFRIFDEHGNSRPCSNLEPITWPEWMALKTKIVMDNLDNELAMNTQKKDGSNE